MIKDTGFSFCFIATVCGTIEVKEVFPWPPVISFGENCLLYLSSQLNVHVCTSNVQYN